MSSGPTRRNPNLRTYFTGEGTANGEQVYFALSRGNDPLHWRELNGGNPVFSSAVGDPDGSIKPVVPTLESIDPVTPEPVAAGEGVQARAGAVDSRTTSRHGCRITPLVITPSSAANRRFTAPGPRQLLKPSRRRATNPASPPPAGSTPLPWRFAMSTHRTRRRLAPCNGGVNQNVSQSGSTPQILGTCLGSSGGTANGATIVLRDCGGRAYQRWTRG